MKLTAITTAAAIQGRLLGIGWGDASGPGGMLRVRGVFRRRRKKSAAAMVFISEPPAMTKRLSALQSMLTAVIRRGLPPVMRHAPPWPKPS